MPFNPDPQNTAAISKKKPGKKTQSSHSDDPSVSVENLICLEILRKESLATWLQITGTQVKLAQLNTSFLLQQKLLSAIAPTAASLPGLPLEVTEFPSLNQFRSRKKTGPWLPNSFLSSSKGTVEQDNLELAEFVCGYLEFCKEQPESSKAPLFQHLHLLMERAITYS